MTSALPWRSSLHASVATATVLLLAIGLVVLARSGERIDLRLAGFDAGWTWTNSTQLLPPGADEPEGRPVGGARRRCPHRPRDRRR